MDVGGGDEATVDAVRHLGPVPPTGPVDSPPGVEGGHAASTLVEIKDVSKGSKTIVLKIIFVHPEASFLVACISKCTGAF